MAARSFFDFQKSGLYPVQSRTVQGTVRFFQKIWKSRDALFAILRNPMHGVIYEFLGYY